MSERRGAAFAGGRCRREKGSRSCSKSQGVVGARGDPCPRSSRNDALANARRRLRLRQGHRSIFYERMEWLLRCDAAGAVKYSTMCLNPPLHQHVERFADRLNRRLALLLRRLTRLDAPAAVPARDAPRPPIRLPLWLQERHLRYLRYLRDLLPLPRPSPHHAPKRPGAQRRAPPERSRRRRRGRRGRSERRKRRDRLALRKGAPAGLFEDFQVLGRPARNRRGARCQAGRGCGLG